MESRATRVEEFEMTANASTLRRKGTSLLNGESSSQMRGEERVHESEAPSPSESPFHEEFQHDFSRFADPHSLNLIHRRLEERRGINRARRPEFIHMHLSISSWLRQDKSEHLPT
ncbi:hypothetical protein OIU76_030253 [Salix suchowensis]|nr:hypothetical protein OIU76_030253 [Salix suchowensis]